MKRTIALGAAWTASAAAAVGLGFLAVSLVDASASPGTTLAAATTAPSATSSAQPSTTPSSPTGTTTGASSTGQYDTAGGRVFADCATGTPLLAGVPASGWVVDDSNDPGELEFESGAQKVEVHVTCAAGVPVFSLDDSSSSSSRASSSSSPASATSGHDDSGRSDDSSGRDGGGHGSDDGPGDDSSGRGGGGHGSDD